VEKPFDCGKLNDALGLLNLQLVLAASPKTEIVVCGGSALIALALVPRTTQDVSPGFREILKDMLMKLGWGDVGAEL